MTTVQKLNATLKEQNTINILYVSDQKSDQNTNQNTLHFRSKQSAGPMQNPPPTTTNFDHNTTAPPPQQPPFQLRAPPWTWDPQAHLRRCLLDHCTTPPFCGPNKSDQIKHIQELHQPNSRLPREWITSTGLHPCLHHPCPSIYCSPAALSTHETKENPRSSKNLMGHAKTSLGYAAFVYGYPVPIHLVKPVVHTRLCMAFNFLKQLPENILLSKSSDISKSSMPKSGHTRHIPA